MLQYSLVGPLHDAMSKVHKYSVYGVCTTNGARGPASPLLGPAHCHTATVAHIVALTPGLKEEDCRAPNEDVLEALDRLWSPMSARTRILRRHLQTSTSEGKNGLGSARASRGHFAGSREVLMVRTPADPLGSRTPSRGRSQRRDTGRGPAFRCMRISTHIVWKSDKFEDSPREEYSFL